MQQVAISVDLRAFEACCALFAFHVASNNTRAHTLCLQDLHYSIIIKIYLMLAELIKQPFHLCAFVRIRAENFKSFRRYPHIKNICSGKSSKNP